jgi:hypothetical protein
MKSCGLPETSRLEVLPSASCWAPLQSSRGFPGWPGVMVRADRTMSYLEGEGLPCLADFWNHIGHTDWCKQHPLHQEPDRVAFTIPATMFGDDARIYKDEKMTDYQFGFMLSASALSTFIVTVLPNWTLIPGKTLPDIERCITWMWQCAFAGRWPLTDHLGRDITSVHGERRFALRGEPLCKGEPRFRIAMAAFKADLAFEMQTFKFKTYNQNEMCRECHAHKTNPDMLYTRLGPTAPWRLRVRTTASYVCDHAETLPAFVLIPGWCLEIHRYDLMHVVFLGLALHLVGSCIMDLAERGFWRGATIRLQLLRAWFLYLVWCHLRKNNMYIHIYIYLYIYLYIYIYIYLFFFPPVPMAASRGSSCLPRSL